MGSTLGQALRVTTFGESHGVALGCVVDGCPPNIPLSEKDVQFELDKRKPGQSKLTTARGEKDKVIILSGVFEGKTLGTPIAMMVENSDAKSGDYENLKDVYRPGHADFTWEMKYGFRDYRGGGRSSGRETVGRVMAGAVAKKILESQNILVFAYAKQIGNIKGEKIDFDFIEKNSLRAADPKIASQMEKCILEAKNNGDSVGGIVEIIVKNVPVGLGEPVFDKLNANLAKALMSIPATKGVEFGSGFSAATSSGYEQNDPFTFISGKIALTKNDSGGISGGISNGEDIIIRVAVKPTSSISKLQKTVTKDGKLTDLNIQGRHDPCIVPRLVPVAASMAAIVIADHLLMHYSALDVRRHNGV